MEKVKFKKMPFKYPIRRDNGELYMMRYNLFQCPAFTIKLHIFHLSDDECMHDHPWWFLSFILWGGYVEHTEKEMIEEHYQTSDKNPEYLINRKYIKKESKIVHPFSILFRPAEHKHRVEVHQKCVTLVITGRRTRQWGFWTKNGWIEYFKYKFSKDICG